MAGLSDSLYLKFPFRISDDGPLTSTRSDHVREQIEQVLFTNPKERVFRPEFGAGIRRLVFEPNSSALWNITRKELTTALAQALYGEVDPKTLKVDIQRNEDSLIIHISYMLAAINQNESHTFTIAGQSNG